MTRKDLQILLEKCFCQLYEKDGYLIANESDRMGEDRGTSNHLCERCIVSHFAHYLQNEIDKEAILQEYHIDCEYNRHGYDKKSLSHFANGTYPDLIIHKRGNDQNNFLVMEFKTWWNNSEEALVRDATKYRALWMTQMGIDTAMDVLWCYIRMLWCCIGRVIWRSRFNLIFHYKGNNAYVGHTYFG